MEETVLSQGGVVVVAVPAAGLEVAGASEVEE